MKSLKLVLTVSSLLVILASSVLFCEENKEDVLVKAGNDFVIVLESNPTTGYGWQLSGPLSGGLVSFIRSEFVPADNGLCGAAGEEKWYFKALKEGIAVIRLRYVRPWEKDVPPVEEKEITVNISADEK